RGLTRRKGVAPHILHGLNTWVAELRRIKSPAEIDLMRKAAAITHDGHIAAMQAVAPGLHEYDLQAILEYEYRRSGAQGVAYESIVATGSNATVLHYVENRSRIADGDLVLVDSGAEFHGYAADVTRTFPANGRFRSEQRALYDIVLKAMNEAFTQVRPGVARTAYHDRAVATITHGLLDLGILHGSFDEAIESQAYQEYYMHGTGHWLGLDVHDAGRYRDYDDTPTRLEPGMALTVEPGIYVRHDAPCDPRFHGIGIRIEDDLIVTNDGFENLTAAIPKSIDDLSAIMQAKVSA
ncbi:MAG: M24B family metallopeptidase, partial [Vulcanimicrobiaceae bacterium]